MAKHLMVLMFLLGLVSAVVLPDQSLESQINPLATSPNNLWTKWEIKTWSKRLTKCLKLSTYNEQTICLNSKIIELTKARGARFALDVIQPLAQVYPDPFLTTSHEFAHLIGDYALDYDYLVEGDAESKLISKMGRALVDCDGWGAFGCYHGVIEVGLSRLRPEDRTRVIKVACMENPLIQQHRAYINQCLHWFGHGMAVFTDQPLSETLDICEGLNPNSFPSDEVQLCVSGVFHAGAVPGEVDAQYNHYISRVYSASDPYFPCQDVEDKFKGQCYSQLVGRSGMDIETQLSNCDKIPETHPEAKLNYVRRCYNSGANNLLVQAKFEVDESIRLCQRYSNRNYLSDCYAGVVRYSILRDPLLNNDFPFVMCAKIESEHKRDCYLALGAANYENYFDEELLSEYCGKVEKEYYGACMSKDPLQAPIVVVTDN